MEERLKQGEVISKATDEEVEELRLLIAEKRAINELMLCITTENKKLCKKQDDFWLKIANKYLISHGTNFYIDFNTKEIKRGF